jgi:hypothetical protein
MDVKANLKANLDARNHGANEYPPKCMQVYNKLKTTLCDKQEDKTA